MTADPMPPEDDYEDDDYTGDDDAGSVEPDEPVLRFEVEEDRARGPATRFTIGDDPTVLLARRPKAALIMKLFRLAESGSPIEQLQSIDLFVDMVLDGESADYLRDRFEDPADEWDYDVLTPVVKALTAQWFGRPTGRSPGSSRRPNRSGRRSTARRR
jgi:hypothetical protein